MLKKNSSFAKEFNKVKKTADLSIRYVIKENLDLINECGMIDSNILEKLNNLFVSEDFKN